MTGQKIISVMWSIRNSRNRWTDDKEKYDLVHSVQRIKEDLALHDIPKHQVIGLPGHGWRPLDQGWVKINTDGALNSEASIAGAGGVARATALLGAWCKPHVGVTDLMIAEALSLRDGVILQI
ncbi:hypothetical protein ZWY2020_048171 [Hordeum vulgare]|nr:hypothetical protein ZWY2020_048171 [Hordeum vulgare]